MEDKRVKCPFNPLHIVYQSSLQKHVLRCMINYPDYVACPYNALHQFKNKELLMEHIAACPSKLEIDCLTYNEDFGEKQIVPDVPIHMEGSREYNLKYENWDDTCKT